MFEKIGEKATTVGRKTVKYTGNVAKQVKLKLKMEDKKSQIEDIYVIIGEKVYREYVLGEEIPEELVSECETLDKLAEEVEYCRMEILRLRAKKQCKECHREINFSYKFCPMCGTSFQ